MTFLYSRMAVFVAISVLLMFTVQDVLAGPLRDRLMERRHQQEFKHADIEIVRDIAYGSDERQRFDVYHPKSGHNLPVILMVHGGAWVVGDKASQAVVENKVAHWVTQGFVLISINYPMLPKAAPLEQARHVARALAVAQEQAASWGGNKNKFILMGHSAGAHLVALLASAPDMANAAGALPWLGSVVLDSAALDVVQIMEKKHARFYDAAFGADVAYWKSTSPFVQLQKPNTPMLVVCSTKRDDSCEPAHALVSKAVALGMKATVLEKNMTHKEINQRLGEERDYTAQVDAFIRTLDGR